ncbi:hypothetical protein ACLKA7_010481 [Drosophila subpalustris]
MKNAASVKCNQRCIRQQTDLVVAAQWLWLGRCLLLGAAAQEVHEASSESTTNKLRAQDALLVSIWLLQFCTLFLSCFRWSLAAVRCSHVFYWDVYNQLGSFQALRSSIDYTVVQLSL